MHFDDRLATVLHHRAAGERAARVQFRQLLDLLGASGDEGDPALTRAAYRRLDSLALMIPIVQRERIAAECSPRLRSPRLLAWLAQSEPAVALAALSHAGLTGAQWTALIPELPVRARGLLRHRRNLPRTVLALLEKLGVYDRALPEPLPAFEADRDDRDWLTIGAAQLDAAADAGDSPATALDLGTYPEERYVLSASDTEDDGRAPATAPSSPPIDRTNLSALVRRIEDFQRSRERRHAPATPDDPRLPLADDGTDASAAASAAAILFTTDAMGRIDWAASPHGPSLVGTLLGASGHDPVRSQPIARAFRLRRPLVGAALRLEGGADISGEWLADAAPRFAPRSGQFTGYVGRLRRPAPAPTDTAALRAADRVRQLLHELRTPVTAIQGFSEVIQQQTIGPVPHEYRAIAAAIAGDAARMLAGFAEIERLAKLEAGTLPQADGSSDFAAILRRRAAQLQAVLSPRVARLEGHWDIEEAHVPMEAQESETLAWRLLGTLASAIAAGEKVAFTVDRLQDRLRVMAQLPAALAQVEDIFAADVRPAAGQIGTGLFGAGFALRLARAEARAVGGDVVRVDTARIVLTLPLANPRTASAAPAPRQSEKARP